MTELNQEQITTHDTNLLKCYTFTNFVVGDNNNFALAFARAVSESPGTEYNPLFLYSNVGLGKTHLMNSIGNAIIQRMPDKKVLYIPSQQFEAELVEAIQYNKIEEFRSKYINLDVLLLDDIQFIASRESAQQEFFHAFNSLFNNGKQIVLTSDRPPSVLSTLEQRLRSRFEGGIITEIHPPDLETRKAILCKKMQEKGVIVSDEVIHLLCDHIKDDIRKLEGALKETLAFAKLTNKPVTLEIAEQVINQKLAQYDKIQRGLNPLLDPNHPELLKQAEIKLQSPNDSAQAHPEQKQTLNIEVSLPPDPKKSMINMPGKSLQLDSTSPELPQEKTSSSKIDLSKTNLKRSSESSKINVSGAMPQQNVKEPEADLSTGGLSLTSAFTSNQIAQKLDQNKPEFITPSKSSQKTEHAPDQAPSVPAASAKTPAPAEPAQHQPAVPPTGAGLENDNAPSLTNIFSSREVKEKINKLIAVGADGEDSAAQESRTPTPSPQKSNVFVKEHKKKLDYELKYFDAIVKKVDKGKVTIIDFDAYETFREHLDQSHAFYKEENYQDGLDAIRKTKDAYYEMLSTEERKTTGAQVERTASFPWKKTIIISAIIMFSCFIAFIVWKTFFAA
ncbi:MAG: DnaA/Hda family protein [Candidatus Auribacterota bacterium]